MTASALAAFIPDRAIECLLENLSTSLSYILFFAGMLLLQREWRPGRKCMWLLLLAMLFVLQPIIYFGHYLAIIKQLCSIPSVLIMIFCCRPRTPIFWLSLCTMCLVVSLCGILSSMLFMLLPVASRLLFKLPLTMLSILAVYFFLQPAIRQLEQTVEKGWGYLCAIPIGIQLFLLSSSLALDDYVRGGARFPLLLAIALIAITGTVYGILTYFFRSIYLRQQQTHDNDVLRTQMAAVVRRADEITRQDEAERVFRHDLRHHVNALSTCIDAGAYEEARALLQRTQQTLNGLEQTRQTITRYTGRPILDAVLSSYGDAFGRCGAQYRVRLALPDVLEPDLAELSTVLSNALENALHACLALPKGRERAVKVLGEPHGAQFLLTVSNTCPDGVSLDPSTALPRATRPGHGYGTRSIAIFAARWGGVLDYQVADGWFHMHLLI
ncbi:GHKL domain-containing protein [Agathobaculum sp. NTUH-O15-33]|uniref:sensor histidine kinase n=1 Tax=Agathobaculum sp. NTUH-O15-33 TaxID=3079302 RepID=UPI0029589741|nr:GHKL domain-containing protein [Agathobaculum sp. NTUH-O15-33]WNX85550.1 GHKL domain-containing protein [Agathobaculum sp. NTUH-O15-33]